MRSVVTSSFEKPLIIKDKRALETMAKGFARTEFRRSESTHDIDAELQRGRALLRKLSSRLHYDLCEKIYGRLAELEANEEARLLGERMADLERDPDADSAIWRAVKRTKG